MRRPARDLALLVVAAVAIAATPVAAIAQESGFSRAVRDLDGAQFLEDEPIWVCDAGGLVPHRLRDRVDVLYRLWHVGTGDTVSAPYPKGTRVGPPARAGELVQALSLPSRAELHPLDVGLSRGSGGLRAGSYEFLPMEGFGDRPLCRFRVVEPRGSESSVRAALARAARLAALGDESSLTQAARLYEAVLERYPRTSYVTVIYAGLWRVRAHTRAYAADPGAWLDRIFATFHDTCFGVWALDRFMADMPSEESRPLLRRLMGLYPDTKLARAAGVYL